MLSMNLSASLSRNCTIFKKIQTVVNDNNNRATTMNSPKNDDNSSSNDGGGSGEKQEQECHDPILTPRTDYLRYVAMDGEYPELGELARKAESLIWHVTMLCWGTFWWFFAYTTSGLPRTCAIWKRIDAIGRTS